MHLEKSYTNLCPVPESLCHWGSINKASPVYIHTRLVSPTVRGLTALSDLDLVVDRADTIQLVLVLADR